MDSRWNEHESGDDIAAVRYWLAENERALRAHDPRFGSHLTEHIDEAAPPVERKNTSWWQRLKHQRVSAMETRVARSLTEEEARADG